MTNLLKSLAHGSIAAKLAVLAAVGIVSMVLVAVTVLTIARTELSAERVEKGHAIVDIVWNMADSFHHAAETGAMTDDEAKARFLAAANAVWWSKCANWFGAWRVSTRPEVAAALPCAGNDGGDPHLTFVLDNVGGMAVGATMERLTRPFAA